MDLGGRLGANRVGSYLFIYYLFFDFKGLFLNRPIIKRQGFFNIHIL